MEIAGTGPYCGVKTRHGFEVVVEDVGPRRDDLVERRALVQKVRGQYLDRGAGRGRADRRDGPRKLVGTTILDIVAVDRGDDDVGEAQGRDRRTHPLGLSRV